MTALGQTWCPNHFSCAMPDCKRELHDIGFVEEKKQLYCEGCFETHLAPNCSRCSKRVKGVRKISFLAICFIGGTFDLISFHLRKTGLFECHW